MAALNFKFSSHSPFLLELNNISNRVFDSGTKHLKLLIYSSIFIYPFFINYFVLLMI